MIFGYFGSPEAHCGARGLILEARGPILKISGIIVIFGGAPARKGIPILIPKYYRFLLIATPTYMYVDPVYGYKIFAVAP